VIHNNYSESILAEFRKKFSTNPQVYFSPGRINLIGEHVDYNDGFVMPAAISKGIYYAVALNQGLDIHFYSVDFNEHYSTPVNDIHAEDNWKNYVLSVVNEFELLGVEMLGFDCVFGGDIPRGSGMSSSAAVEGGLAFALNELFGAGFTRMQLALLCQRAEHGYPSVQCGIMDQFANMMGKKGEVILLDCQSINHVYIPLRLNGYQVVLLNSKVHHSLAGSEYNVRRKQCNEGLVMIGKQTGITSFRDINDPAELLPFKASMTDEVYKRCQYVVEEINRTELASKYLHENKLVEFGQLLFETHKGLRDLYEVSCEELDFLVALAEADDAVIGARLMGGGFGGCTINIVADSSVSQFIKSASEAYYNKFKIVAEATIVETSDGVTKLHG
jgi:galactokinase